MRTKGAVTVMAGDIADISIMNAFFFGEQVQKKLHQPELVGKKQDPIKISLSFSAINPDCPEIIFYLKFDLVRPGRTDAGDQEEKSGKSIKF